MAASGYSELRGAATDNVVNVLSPTGGIQLEPSRGVRETYKSRFAIGVANAGRPRFIHPGTREPHGHF